MRKMSTAWEVPDMICFLLGLAGVLVGFAAAGYQAVIWMRSGKWVTFTNGEIIDSFGYGDIRQEAGAFDGALGWLWPQPFWVTMVAIGIAFIYVTSLARTLFHRRR